MTIQRILPASRYSEAVIVNGLIFCAGMVPNTRSTDATIQTEDVLAQVDALLAQCGSDKTKLVDATIYLADMADYAAMNGLMAYLTENCCGGMSCSEDAACLPSPERKSA